MQKKLHKKTKVSLKTQSGSTVIYINHKNGCQIQNNRLSWSIKTILMAYFGLHCMGTRLGHVQGNGTRTKRNNGSWFLSLSWTSVNISTQKIRRHLYWSRSLYLSRSHAM